MADLEPIRIEVLYNCRRNRWYDSALNPSLSVIGSCMHGEGWVLKVGPAKASRRRVSDVSVLDLKDYLYEFMSKS